MRIGRFEVLRYVAAGGMAEIYLVRASGIAGFEKTLVLKRIHPDHADDPQFIEMFLDEARLAATLDHPNIVHVHDIGESDGSYFFTMEYVRGASVLAIQRAVRRTGRSLGLAPALAIVAGAAGGLHYAHEHKRGGKPLDIVHRDVSPSNVLVTFDGGVKLVDFGIAKAAARRTQTTTGTVKGKHGYMSPEQCRGGAVDRRSDIFALGILLFELTTGSTLFPGDNEFEVVHKVCNEPVPRPSSVVADYPAALERIVLRALEREPDARFATARDLELELDDFARDHKLSLSTVTLTETMRELLGDALEREGAPSARRSELATPMERPLRRRRRVWSAVALASGLVAAGGGTVWLVTREPQEPIAVPALPERARDPDPAPRAPTPQPPGVPPVGPPPATRHAVHRARPEPRAVSTSLLRDESVRVTPAPDAGAIDLEGMLPPGE
jgi:serine/threonine protein kinase